MTLSKKPLVELGLTTIELVAALSLMSLTAIVLLGILRPPLNAIEQIQSRIEVEESLRRFHERMLSDFASIRAGPSVQNLGLSFGANYVEVTLLRAEPEIVRYAFDENEGLFARTVFTEDSSVALRSLKVTDATISVFDGSTWLQSGAFHSNVCIPKAIRIELKGVSKRQSTVDWVIPVYVGREWKGQEVTNCSLF